MKNGLLSYEQRVRWFVNNYYETGMEYGGMLQSMKDANLDAFPWYDDVIAIPKYGLKKKFLIIGHKRHGKDTVAGMLRELYGYTGKSSSEAAAEIFIFDTLKDEFGYTTLDECYQDRVSDEMRERWYNMICEYNKEDKSRLARDIMSYNDIYTGMRDPGELEVCRKKDLFDYIIGVFDPRKPLEAETSMKINIWKESDTIIPNSGDLEELRQKLVKLESLFA